MYYYLSSIEFQQVPFIYTFKPFKCLLSVGIDIDYVDLSLLIWKVHQLRGLQFRKKKKSKCASNPTSSTKARVNLSIIHDL